MARARLSLARLWAKTCVESVQFGGRKRLLRLHHLDIVGDSGVESWTSEVERLQIDLNVSLVQLDLAGCGL